MSKVYAIPYYPVGSILEFDREMDMGSIYGGTWQLYAPGRVSVCIDENDRHFNIADMVGGEILHTLTQEEMPSHAHSVLGVNPGAQMEPKSGSYPPQIANDIVGNWVIPSDLMYASGTDMPHNNLQPYVVVYRYHKVAD